MGHLKEIEEEFSASSLLASSALLPFPLPHFISGDSAWHHP
jgi:hypothetical protein